MTVKEDAKYFGGWPRGLTRAQVGRKAADWCQRKGLPTGEAEEDGRRVKARPDAALRNAIEISPGPPPFRESPFC